MTEGSGELAVRIPAWSERSYQVLLNGQALDAEKISTKLVKGYPYLDVQNGGEVKFTTSVDVFFPALEIYDKEGNKVGKYSYKKTDTEWNFEIGVIKKIGECSYKIEGFPNNSDNYKCLAIYVHSIDEKVDANSMVVFLDENALIE